MEMTDLARHQVSGILQVRLLEVAAWEVVEVDSAKISVHKVLEIL